MGGRIISKAAFILLGTVGTCWAGCCTKSLDAQCRKEVKVDPVDSILEQLNRKTSELVSYQGRIEYEVDQPLIESKTLRKGVLYYQKSDKESKLRINFQTLKQDDEEEQKYVDQYIFDGIWLTHIDYQIEAARRYQLVDPNAVGDTNEPVDAFELVSRYFPLVGFSKAEDLKKKFAIKFVEKKESKPAEFIQLHLKVKPDSVYKDDYVSMDFWIDRKWGLPAKIAAVSTGGEIYQIELLKPKINKKTDKKVFDVKIPKGFAIKKVPPKKSRKVKGQQQEHRETKDTDRNAGKPE